MHSKKFVSLAVPANEEDLPTAKESALDFTAAPTDADLRCPFYCEENVWRLAYRKMLSDQTNHQDVEYFVAFISNSRKNVPMFYQRAASDEETPCVWDYHVILIEAARSGKSSSIMVYDVDTTLSPYPITLDLYADYTFPDELASTNFAPLFRVIPASKYLHHFESDRSHMYNAHTSSWSAPPPSYQCIFQPNSSSSRTKTGTRNNLKQYLIYETPLRDQDLLPNEALGVVLNLEQFRLGKFREKLVIHE